MILLISDIILSFFSRYPIYLFLLDILLIKKEDIDKIIIHSLILDLLVLNSSLVVFLIYMIIFLIYKKLPIKRVGWKNYIFSITLIFGFFTGALGIINRYSLKHILKVQFKYYLVNLPIYILSYKILEKRIKLAR